MKNIYISFIALLAVFSQVTTGCIEETFPKDVATKDQIENSATAIESLANATAAFMNAYAATELYAYTDFGYAAMMLDREVMVDQFPISKTAWDYFNAGFGNTGSLYGTYPYVVWTYYYKLINNAHSVIGAVNSDNETEKTKRFLGTALGYRALAYMDLARMFEYKRTGVPDLDQTADEDKVWGLTIPIVTEQTTEAEARSLPRAPFYQMYRFIMNDLNRAETCLEGYQRPTKNMMNSSVIHGFKARMWLELATRFEESPEDLNTQLSHEDDSELAQYDKLGITSARTCYENAIAYARKAMQGYSPVTEEQWHDTSTGFNRSNTQNSWILAVLISPNNVKNNYINYISNISCEALFGVVNHKYDCYRMISKRFFEQISSSDWRKVTWIAPEDAGKTPGTKYHTLLDDAAWAKAPAYTGFKFRPGSGSINDYINGAATDIPVMRMEEMYFILAEATAHTEGMQAGAKILADFVNTYRYTDHSYTFNPTTMDEFNEQMMLQKRIEFWGEGVVYFDYKRLKLQITRGYPGTNYVSSQRFNSIPGYVAPWCNLCITETEQASNQALILNPDPTKAIQEWSE